MSALGRVVRSGVGRRKLQTAVMALTMLVAVAACVLAAGLLVASRAPFEQAFNSQNGADLGVQFDGGKATAAEVAATSHANGVTSASGPFDAITTSIKGGANAGQFTGAELPAVTVAARSYTGGAVDDLALVSGTWATAPGQIVISASSFPFGVGARLEFTEAPGDPTLTVVGVARSVGDLAGAWVTPAELTTLAAGGPVEYQMYYRFTNASTDTQISADRAAIAADAPGGALTSWQSYLALEQSADKTTGTFVPFIAAFGVLGLVMSVLIISIVVSGAVSSSIRRIGILKSIGFTPGQVVRAYIAQAFIPAAVGIVLGVLLGNALAVPVLSQADNVYGYGTPTIPLWIDVAVPAVAVAVVVAAALVPSLRAGRLRTVEAIVISRTPPATYGRTARTLLGRLPLPRPLSLGLANPLARPARTATIAAALIFGAVAVTFAVGLGTSLGDVQAALNRNSPGAVVVGTGGGRMNAGPGAGPGAGNVQPLDPAQSAAVTAAIAAQPGTEAYYGTYFQSLSVSGIAGATQVAGYQGDSSWAAMQMIAGTWFTGPGQAVVPTAYMQNAGVSIGDTITVTNGGRSVQLRVVGEALSLRDNGDVVYTDYSTFTALGIDAVPQSYQVELKPGTSPGAYISSLDSALGQISSSETASANITGASATILAMDTLIAILTVMLVVVAGLGVLNTVVLDTRERVHDFGVFKALGMTPRQTIAMVLTSVGAVALPVGIIAVPIGVLVHNIVVPIMGHAAGTNLPNSDIAVYGLPVLVLLAFGGLVIAVLGALAPAGWAARAGTATALRTE
jgi:putative ABC transport system permease protein